MRSNIILSLLYFNKMKCCFDFISWKHEFVFCCSEFEIELESEGEVFAFLFSNGSLEVEAWNYTKSQGAAYSVLEGGIEETVMVHSELSWAIIIEFVRITESSSEKFLLVVKSEFCANCLSEGGDVVEVQEHITNLQLILGVWLVLQT